MTYYPLSQNESDEHELLIKNFNEEMKKCPPELIKKTIHNYFKTALPYLINYSNKNLHDNEIFKTMIQFKQFDLLTKSSFINRFSFGDWYKSILIHSSKIFNVTEHIEFFDKLFAITIKKSQKTNSFAGHVSQLWEKYFNYHLRFYSEQQSLELFNPLFKANYFEENKNADFIVLSLIKYGKTETLQYFKDKGVDFVQFDKNEFKNSDKLSIYSLLSQFNTITPQQAICVTKFLLKENIPFNKDGYSTFIKFIEKNYLSYVENFIHHVDLTDPIIQNLYSSIQQKSLKTNINDAENAFKKYYDYIHLEKQLSFNIISKQRTKI